MTVYFLDSSVIVKRYVIEAGTQWVTNLTLPASTHRIMIAYITEVETTSALARRLRENTLSHSQMRSIQSALAGHVMHEYLRVILNDAILNRAKGLLEVYPLRAYDSIQLASALEASQRLIGSVASQFVFASSDQRLLNVAHAEGLLTVDPNIYP